MKVLILGGGGFLSGAVERRLAASGHAVTVASRSGRARDPGSATATGQRQDPAFLDALAARQFEAVVDFLCFDAEGANQIIKAFSGRLRRLVMISTGSVYWCTGAWRNPVGEDQYPREAVPRLPGSIEYDYGVGKRQAEDCLEDAHRRGDLHSVRLRFPVVAGPGDDTGRYSGYASRLQDGAPLVLPDGGHNLFRHLHLDDAAAVVEAALTCGQAAGAYNAASFEMLSSRDLLGLMADVLGRPEPEMVDIPGAVLERWGMHDLFAPFAARRSQLLDSTRAMNELQFRPTPVSLWLPSALAAAVPQRPGGWRTPARWRPRQDEVQAATRFRAHLEAA